MIGSRDWLLGYAIGKTEGTKHVEITSDLVFTDDGEGNITITEASN